jgi:ribonuclease HI
MKKSKLKLNLTELSKYLKSGEARKAIAILENELGNYQEPEAKQVTIAEFEVPAEIVGKSNAYAVYTDGACRGNPGPGSYGYIIQISSGDIIAKGSEAFKYTTNNKMEMSGVINGVNYLKDKLTPFDEVYVYTDSKYIVDGMKSWVAGWKRRGWKKADKKAPENLDLWKELDELSTICHLSFHWIKGHAGHPQNEFVDQLANIELDKNGF